MDNHAAWLRLRPGKTVATVLMLGLAALTAYPFLWMLVASFTEERQVFAYPVRWIPDPINLQAYKTMLWTSQKSSLPFLLGKPFTVYYLNSIKVTVLSLLGTLLSTTLAAYAFTKIEFKGRNFAFLLLLATMMLPPQVSMLPNFLIFRYLGLVDTHTALWLPTVLGDAFILFLLRQYFITIPKEISESAHIDGAGHLRIYSRIVMPLAMPVIASAAILTFVSSWNNYEGPLIYLRSAELYTIPMALQVMSTNIEAVHNAELMAATVLSVVPIMVVFAIFQRYFVESITMSGVKG